MRNRLALHFGCISFALAWGWICIAGEGSLRLLGAAAVFGALSALVGWLSFSEAGRGWSALRTVGWTPTLALIGSTLFALVVDPEHVYDGAALATVLSL